MVIWMNNKKPAEPQVDKEHYYDGYDSKSRFCSYWHQIDEVKEINPESILEIGVGNKFVYDYLDKYGFNISSIDIDADLNPDYQGSVLGLPFDTNDFELILCCEVLEHIPFEKFEIAIQELKRVAEKYIIISLPHSSSHYRFQLQIPKLGEIKFLFPIPLPNRFKPKHEFDGEHYWEIGKRGYPLKKIVNTVEKYGLDIRKNYRVFEKKHRFFIIEI